MPPTAREKTKADVDPDAPLVPPVDPTDPSPDPVDVRFKDALAEAGGEPEMVPAVTLRVTSFNVHVFRGFVDEVAYEVTNEGTDVPTDVADSLIEQALSCSVRVERVEEDK